mgnify:CR=1 FL=1
MIVFFIMLLRMAKIEQYAIMSLQYEKYELLQEVQTILDNLSEAVI